MSKADVQKAKEQRKIDKLKNKTKAEQLKLRAKEARIEARAKNGGVGGSFAFFDRRGIPQDDRKKRRFRWPIPTYLLDVTDTSRRAS